MALSEMIADSDVLIAASEQCYSDAAEELKSEGDLCIETWIGLHALKALLQARSDELEIVIQEQLA